MLTMADVSNKNYSDPKSILIVLPTWVGDFVMATPFLRAVRQRYTHARITFLAEPNLRDLIHGGNWMDDYLDWPVKANRSLLHSDYRTLVHDLRKRQFDWAILLPNSFRSALIAWQSRAKRRFGYNRDGRWFLLTDRVPVTNRHHTIKYRKIALTKVSGSEDGTVTGATGPGAPGPASVHHHGQTIDDVATSKQNITITNIPPSYLYKGKYDPLPMVEYYADLAEAVGCDRPGENLELFTTTQDDQTLSVKLSALGIASLTGSTNRRPSVVLSPGAKFGAAKCWPVDRFAAVADRLIEQDSATVLVTCGPGEEPIARAIRDAMECKAIVMDVPLLTLGELKSLIKGSDLLICNDAGPRHFAKAFDVPVVTIFGPTHPDWTATNYPDERIVRIDIECGPCQRRICPLGHLQCMTGVTVDRVYEAARELLSKRTVVVVDNSH